MKLKQSGPGYRGGVMPAVIGLGLACAAFLTAVPGASAATAAPEPGTAVPSRNSSPEDSPSSLFPVTEPHISLQDHRHADNCKGQKKCLEEFTLGGQMEDKIFDIAALDDGGLALAGATRSHGRLNEDGLVARIDDQGRLLWFRTLGGEGTDRFYGVSETEAGLMVTGHRQIPGQGKSDFWLLLLDRERGGVIWEKSFGGPGLERARNLYPRPDGGAVLVGFTTSQGQGDRDVWVLSVDAQGTAEWERTFGGLHDDEATDVAVTQTGDVFVTGFTNSTDDGHYNVWAARLAPDGSSAWDVSYRIGRYALGSSISLLADGGLAVVGLTQQAAGIRENVLVLRLDDRGRALWHKIAGGVRRDSGWGAIAHEDGGFSALASIQSSGAGTSDAWLYRYDRYGNLTEDFGYGYALWDKPTTIAQGKDGSILIGGYTTSIGRGFEDAWVVRLAKPDPIFVPADPGRESGD